MKNIYFYLIISCCGFFTYTAQASSPEQDSLALVAIYNANANNNTGWVLSQPMSSWSGVFLDGDGSVGSLYLSQKSLSILPAEIGNLNNLGTLLLQYNNLNFETLELLVNTVTGNPFLSYDQQDTIITYSNNNILSVNAGGTLSNNTYEWYKNDVPIDTISADSTYLPETTGIYHCVISNAIAVDLTLTSEKVYFLSDSLVYPGDADANGKVEALDVLYWGMGYGNTGPIRPNGDNSWTAQPCEDWTPITNGINGKHQDTNGDGIVDDADLNVIEINFDSLTPAYVYNAPTNNSDYILSIVPTYQSGDSTIYDLMLEHTDSIPIEASGLAFSFEYQNPSQGQNLNAIVVSISANIDNSALGDVSDLGFIQQFDDQNMRLDVGISRKDGSIIIEGPVAEIIVIDPLKGIQAVSAGISNTISADISNVMLALTDTIKPVRGQTLYPPEVVLEEIRFMEQPDIKVYATVTHPNCNHLGVAQLHILEAGEYAYQWSNGANTSVVNNLAPGLYSVTISEPGKDPAVIDIEVHTPFGCPDEVVVSTKVLLEGAYDTGNNLMNDGLRTLYLIPLLDPYIGLNTMSATVLDTNGTHGIVDWLELELRTLNEPELVINRCAALLRRNGQVVATDGFSPIKMIPIGADSVYLVIKHRNHLPVMSPPISSTDTLDFDFTISDCNVLLGVGIGQKEISPGIWAMVGGEIIQDNQINGNDKAAWTLLNGTFSPIYHEVDLNLDGDVNGSDKAIWNKNNGVFSCIP